MGLPCFTIQSPPPPLHPCEPLSCTQGPGSTLGLPPSMLQGRTPRGGCPLLSPAHAKRPWKSTVTAINGGVSPEATRPPSPPSLFAADWNTRSPPRRYRRCLQRGECSKREVGVLKDRKWRQSKSGQALFFLPAVSYLSPYLSNTICPL